MYRKLEDPAILHESHTNNLINRDRHDRFSRRKTVATILLASLIGFTGIWFTWTKGRCLPNQQDDSNSLSIKSAACDVPPPENLRFDCWPQANNVTEKECTDKGCCLVPVNNGSAVPRCYYPPNQQLYNVDSVKKVDNGLYVRLSTNQHSGWPNDVKHLAINITMETNYRLHFKIYDPNTKRYEVPLNVSRPREHIKLDDTDYSIDIPSKGPFHLTVTRKSSNQILFSTRNVAPLVFADQFIQIGTKLSSKLIYGLGEHMDGFLLDTEWSRKILWALDQPPDPTKKDVNLYGVHPFYLNIEGDKNAHGVFLLNSNAMEIQIQSAPALTYRTIGGVLDFYIFTGPTPDNVIEQYTELIGRPFMPPYWALGLHLSRFGYGNTNNLTKVVKRMRAAKMYYDAQWTDIDAMRAHLDWTYDAEGGWKGLDQVVKDLHDHGQRYNILIDPIISVNQSKGTYKPYTDGLAANVFVKSANGSNLIGQGWPGNIVNIDFWHPNATDYWTKQAKTFYNTIPFDSIMIDMNEPSNQVNGSVDGCHDNNLENPPFIPQGLLGGSLKFRTICASSQQYISSHYNIHSLYGHSESIVTKQAMDAVLGKRSIVISRSTFAGSGTYAGHWSGDVLSDWPEMTASITGMLSFQLYGVPFWGADVCGFRGDVPPELCARWTQLGAFYPFMFNHNEVGHTDQDPASFDSYYQGVMRKALELRYYLLPYTYTLFYRTHVHGTPVVRPLFFQFPYSQDDVTYRINEQFLWGTALLVTPALKQNITKGSGYLPKSTWYDFYTHLMVNSPGHFVTFDLPLDNINVQIRGGSIIPMQTPEVTTTLSRKNKFILMAAMDIGQTASGELYWDDGDALDSISGKKYNLIQFSAFNNTLLSTVQHKGYTTEPMSLGTINILGLVVEPSSVTINGHPVTGFTFRNRALYITELQVDLTVPFRLIWR